MTSSRGCTLSPQNANVFVRMLVNKRVIERKWSYKSGKCPLYIASSYVFKGKCAILDLELKCS